mmetsp:Transcript_32372/g.71988  ORF Transcript_32372/g.71988 Transcript_32372/m.71988 type:complete len:222 (-) Transcript_32372:1834-2499(-)
MHHRICSGRDGELGPGDVPRDGADGGRGHGVSAAEAARGHRGGARAGAPVVRQPGDHGLVGRAVAERGLRRLHGALLHRRALPRVQDVGAVHHGRLLRRSETGRAQVLAPRDRAHPARGGGGAGLRRHLLLQGQRRGQHGLCLPGAPAVPGGPAGVHGAPRVRQHGDRRPVGRLVAGLGHGRGLADAHLDHGHGLPLPEGGVREVEGGRGGGHPRAGQVPL